MKTLTGKKLWIFSSLQILAMYCLPSLAENQIRSLVVDPKHLTLSLSISPSIGPTRADLLYLHGYGDNPAHHKRLFSQFNRAGFRVIAFDYPSHGNTQTSLLKDLNTFTVHELGNLALRVEAATREDEDAVRPLFIAGWSLGGLLAVRMIQSGQAKRFQRPIEGLILYAPGVALRKCVGNKICKLDNKTLTHDSSLYKREIKPRSTLNRLKLAFHLLNEAKKTPHTPLPRNLPVLVFVGSDLLDTYVSTPGIKDWVSIQRNFGAKVDGVQCPEAYHELDNELNFLGGSYVRGRSVLFAESILRSTTPHPTLFENQSCLSF